MKRTTLKISIGFVALMFMASCSFVFVPSVVRAATQADMNVLESQLEVANQTYNNLSAGPAKDRAYQQVLSIQQSMADIADSVAASNEAAATAAAAAAAAKTGTGGAAAGTSGTIGGTDPAGTAGGTTAGGTAGGTTPGGTIGGSNSGNTGGGGGGKGGGIVNPLGGNTNSLWVFLNKILDIVIRIGAVVVVIFIILAGLKYVTAQGDEGKISEAHKTLTWTVIGAAVLLGAKTIALVVQNTVGQLIK